MFWSNMPKAIRGEANRSSWRGKGVFASAAICVLAGCGSSGQSAEGTDSVPFPSITTSAAPDAANSALGVDLAALRAKASALAVQATCPGATVSASTADNVASEDFSCDIPDPAYPGQGVVLHHMDFAVFADKESRDADLVYADSLGTGERYILGNDWSGATVRDEDLTYFHTKLAQYGAVLR
jgi:hypothetical protein